MKKISILFLIFCFLIAPASAELVRQKNVATHVVFPIVKNDGTLITGATGLDSEIDAWTDSTAPNGFTDCTNEAIEIGSTAQYVLTLDQSEMNNDYIIVQVKTTSTGGMTQTLLLRTIVGDPLNIATTDDGGAINVTTGKIDEVATLTGHTAQTGDAYAIVNNGTYGNSAIETLVDDLESRLTATRAGYLDYLNTINGKLPTNYIMGSSVQTAKDDEIDAILADTGAMDTSGELRTLLFGSDTAGATAANQTTIIGYIDTEIAAILEDTGTTLPAAIPAASAIADAVWDEAISGHLAAGSTGNALNAAGSAGDPWSTPLPGAYGAGTAGYIVGNNLNAPIGTVNTVVDAIKAKTDSLTFTGAGIVDANVVNWKGSAAAAMTGDAYARLGAPSGASVSADIAAVKSDSAAILTDTAAMDTANELRTLLTGGTSALSILTTSDNIGINWADVVNPTAAVNLSGTTISTSQAVASVSGAVGSVTSGVTVTTNNDKTGYALSAASVDAIWDEAQSGHTTAGTFGYYLDSQVSAAGSGGLTVGSIADAVWDEAIAGHLSDGSAGNKLNAAGNAGDPWSVALPGDYEAGTAGKMLSDIQDATDGDKESDVYTGIEKMIRIQR